MLTFPLHPLQLAGIVFTIALLALAWASRGRLNSMGFEFLHWNRTNARENAEALGFGVVCGLAVALPGTVQRRAVQMAGCLDRNHPRPADGRGAFSRVPLQPRRVGAPEASSPGRLDCGDRDCGSIRALSSSETRHHWSADRRDLRNGRRLRLAEDQVEFDNVALPGAFSIQRHHFRGGCAARVK